MFLKKHIRKLLTPGKREDRGEIRYWQDRILRHLLFFCAILGCIVYFPSVALSIKEELWEIAVVDTFIYLYALLLFFFPQISYTIRAVSFTAIAYLLGLVLLLVLGPFGAGPVWLMSFPVLTGLFLGHRSAVSALIINGVTISVVGVLVMIGIIAWGPGIENSIEKWVVSSLNFMLLNTILVLSVTSILRGLQDALEHEGKSKKKYRRIFNNIQDVYYEEEMDGTIREISPSIERVTRFSQADLLHTPFQAIYDKPEERERLTDEIEKKGMIRNYEIRIRDKDGTLRTCSVNARLLENGDLHGTRIVGIFRDISRQKQMEERNRNLQAQLDRAKKMEALGLLAGGVAHDLNNMLSSIVGYPELLIMELDENSPLREPLLAIKSSGEKAAEIIQDLLTLSRRGVLTREAISLNEVVETFMETPECRHILSFHPESSVERRLTAVNPMMLGSPVHLSKTVMNLVSNAAEAQVNGGCITIATTNVTVKTPIRGYTQVEPGEYIVLAVKDEGTGIEPQDLERIFEPFFTKKKMGRSGTGLGMAVIWGTIQDHDGYIDIQSTPGGGTTFTLYFPVTDRKMKKISDVTSYNSYSGNGEHILLVDDVDAQRTVAERMLKKLNYRVSSVESGEKAVAFLQSHSADLLVLDMIMEPGMDGLETYRRILQLHPGQKAVITSGFSETERVKELMKLGAGPYIKKPYSLKEIGRAIQESLLGGDNRCRPVPVGCIPWVD